MAPSLPARTTGSAKFKPSDLFENESHLTRSLSFLSDNQIRRAITDAFSLSASDSYIYRAIAAVNLAQVQAAVDAGAANGLHNWYIDTNQQTLGNPSRDDIEAYIEIFNPKKNAANTLKSFLSNAKKNSLRKQIANHLVQKRHLDKRFVVNKNKNAPRNPYFEFWAWSCKALEWAGPIPDTVNVRMAHHVLPVFMHHFGCVAPSYESLEVIRQASGNRTVYDIGSGNGYWTLMLRQAGVRAVAVDNRQSEYRTMWIADTIIQDGIEWLRSSGGAGSGVLLLVYPVTEGDVTGELLSNYKGKTICVAGTQNKNGYTGFKDMDIEEYMVSRHSEYEKLVQIPLPSFAGKDEALYIFQRQ